MAKSAVLVPSLLWHVSCELRKTYRLGSILSLLPAVLGTTVSNQISLKPKGGESQAGVAQVCFL